MFRNPSTNAFQETVMDVPTDGATLINLDTDSYNLLFNETAYYVAQSLQGADAEYDAMFWGGSDGTGGEYGKALKKYQMLNPSETILKTDTYYRPANRGNNRYFYNNNNGR